MQLWDVETIRNMESRKRANLLNKVSGIKGANLIGTSDSAQRTNLAIFQSVIHVGANPPLLGLLFRPLSVERHTYDNIKASGYFTINQVHEEIYRQAHQTSAKYPEGLSEFTATGLTPVWSDQIQAPYVKESRIRIGLAFEEEHLIRANDTLLVIGRMLELYLPEGIVGDDGDLDLARLKTVGIGGLDSYYSIKRLGKQPLCKALGFTSAGEFIHPPLEPHNIIRLLKGFQCSFQLRICSIDEIPDRLLHKNVWFHPGTDKFPTVRIGIPLRTDPRCSSAGKFKKHRLTGTAERSLPDYEASFAKAIQVDQEVLCCRCRIIRNEHDQWGFYKRAFVIIFKGHGIAFIPVVSVYNSNRGMIPFLFFFRPGFQIVKGFRYKPVSPGLESREMFAGLPGGSDQVLRRKEFKDLSAYIGVSTAIAAQIPV